MVSHQKNGGIWKLDILTREEEIKNRQFTYQGTYHTCQPWHCQTESTSPNHHRVFLSCAPSIPLTPCSIRSVPPPFPEISFLPALLRVQLHPQMGKNHPSRHHRRPLRRRCVRLRRGLRRGRRGRHGLRCGGLVLVVQRFGAAAPAEEQGEGAKSRDKAKLGPRVRHGG